jgi:lipoate-protein ligase A
MLKSLEECIEIGERLIADDYVKYPDAVVDWFSKHDSLNEEIPEDIRELMREAFDESEKKKEEDNEIFFNTMKKYHYDWWT